MEEIYMAKEIISREHAIERILEIYKGETNAK